MEFDTFNGEWDAPTVTPAGEPVTPVIEGVLTRRAVTHVDHRGRLFEVFNASRPDEFWADPVVHSYVFTIRVGTLKGWGVHREKTDRYCLVSGETMTVLYDARTQSPTYGRVQEVPLSPEGVRMVLIPPGVYHLSVNVAPVETVLLNLPTRTYRYESPDRLTLPWHTEHVPVDVAKYFPRQQPRPAP